MRTVAGKHRGVTACYPSILGCMWRCERVCVCPSTTSHDPSCPPLLPHSTATRSAPSTGCIEGCCHTHTLRGVWSVHLELGGVEDGSQRGQLPHSCHNLQNEPRLSTAANRTPLSHRLQCPTLRLVTWTDCGSGCPASCSIADRALESLYPP